MSAQRMAWGHTTSLDAIRELIVQNDIEAATNRFLDFARRHRPAQRDEAILLTRRWTEISENRRMGISQPFDRHVNELSRDLLAALTVAAEQAGPSVPFRPEMSKGAGRYVEGMEKRGIARLAKSRPERIPGATALRCQGLQFSYQNSASTFRLGADAFELQLGQFTALIGPNGAGKTTLMRILAGERRPQQGDISYPGLGPVAADDWYAIRQAISYVSQTGQPWRGTMLENLRFEAAAYGYLGADNDEIVEYILSRLRLHTHADSSWEQLSAGYRTRFSLARALLSDPVILILDEPLAFLDPGIAVGYLNDVVDLTQWQDKPIAALVSSQHVHEIEAVADQVLFIDGGQVDASRSEAMNAGDGHAVFEIRCDLTASELQQVCQQFGAAHIKESLVYSTVSLPQGMTGNHALARLLEAGVAVHYFRDITRSTKRRFV